MIPKPNQKKVTTPKEADGSSFTSLLSISAGSIDPFQTLAVDASRLQILLHNGTKYLGVGYPRLTYHVPEKARQAPEPVFSVAKELMFQNFQTVFRTGLSDPALSNALMLSLALAATDGRVDLECLGYQGQAMKFIRKKMTSLDEAATESTIGAILLLAGVGVCRPSCPDPAQSLPAIL